MTGLIVGLIVSMVFSAFFSGMEIAFVSSNRLLAEMDKEKNGLAQRAIAIFYHHPNNFVSTMLVGNNIALVIYGILFAAIFDELLFSGLSDGARVTADTLLSTLVVLWSEIEWIVKGLFKGRMNDETRYVLNILSGWSYSSAASGNYMNNLITLPTYPIYIVELPIQLALDTVLIPFDWLNTPSCPEGYQKEF